MWWAKYKLSSMDRSNRDLTLLHQAIGHEKETGDVSIIVLLSIFGPRRRELKSETKTWGQNDTVVERLFFFCFVSFCFLLF